MVLQMSVIPAAISATFTSQFDDIIKVASTGSIGVINKKSGSNTEFYIESVSASQSLKNIFNVPVRIKVRNSGKYLSQDSTGIPIATSNIPNKDTIFTLQKDITGANMVKIVDENDNVLTIIGKNGLQFTKPDKNTSSIRMVFRIDSKYVIL
jgi:hypothetical protein